MVWRLMRAHTMAPYLEIELLTRRDDHRQEIDDSAISSGNFSITQNDYID